jgi:hypothetical protein
MSNFVVPKTENLVRTDLGEENYDGKDKPGVVENTSGDGRENRE